MSWNNFSRGLPDAFASMTSLTTLGASDCQLTTLPERWAYVFLFDSLLHVFYRLRKTKKQVFDMYAS